MDIKELESLFDAQKVQLTKSESDMVTANDELERMRIHQQLLLNETKGAKEQRNQTTELLTELQKKFDELENKGLVNDGNYEELLVKQTEKLKLNYDNQVSELQVKIDDSNKNYQSLQDKYNSEKINLQIRKVAESYKVLPGAIDDVIFRANGIFTIGEDGSIESRDSEGNLKKIGKKQLTPETFVESLKEVASHLWPVSKGVGASGINDSENSKENPWNKDTFNLTKQVKIANKNPDLAKEMMKEAS